MAEVSKVKCAATWEEAEKDGKQGRWSPEEHRLFIEAVNQFGREWDKVQAVVKTRSLAQVRSHAQKYFLKLSKNEDLERMHENEMWKMSAQPGASNLNALMVLDIMGSVLKKMKVKRDELAYQHSQPSDTSSTISSFSLDSSCSSFPVRSACSSSLSSLDKEYKEITDNEDAETDDDGLRSDSRSQGSTFSK